MRVVPTLAVVGVVGLAGSVHLPALAQQVTVGTPLQTLGDSFFEQTGVHWGFDFKGVHATFGGPNLGAPPFGLYDPSVGIRGGAAVAGNGFDGFLGFQAVQGFRRSFVTQAPVLTLTDGYPGYFGAVSTRPFVTGLVPVVGGLPMVSAGPPVALTLPPPVALPSLESDLSPAPRPTVAPRPPAPVPEETPVDPSVRALTAARTSTAGRAAPGVEEARQLFEREQAAKNDQAAAHFERGLSAKQSGKPSVARTYFTMALRDATGELRRRILDELHRLDAAEP